LFFQCLSSLEQITGDSELGQQTEWGEVVVESGYVTGSAC